MTNFKTIKLIKVDVNDETEIAKGQAKQNNKFYNMIQISATEFKVEYGRVNSTKTEKTYPMSQWDKIYREKINKSKYQDVTELFIDNSPSVVMKDIDDPLAKRLLDTLQSYANTSISKNYTITSATVTPQMVDRAQSHINKIADILKSTSPTVTDVNNTLLELYRTIPRKMNNVQDYLISSDTPVLHGDTLERAKKLIDDEQATLDVMSSQVNINQQQKTTPNQHITLLDMLGLKIEAVTDVELQHIKKLMGDNVRQFKTAYKVVNNNTQTGFDNHIQNVLNKTTELFWHGSRNQNWLNIISTGLLIRPAGAIHTGSMFGDGIYFANKAQKSIGYTSLRGSYWAHGGDNTAYLALYSVHVGKQKHITHHNSSCYKLSHSVIASEGFDSVYAHGGADLRNDEFIVYQPQQCSISYLVEISN